jgi:molybdenum cofactor cytidylyltransferase
MKLSTALRLVPGEIVAFVGAGGKTSAIRHLMAELRGQMLTLATTTTRMGQQEADLTARHHVIQSSEDLEQVLKTPNHGQALLTGPLDANEGKWSHLGAKELNRLIEFVTINEAILLIEADGARKKLLKAPAAHEPVIPDRTTLVVPILRIDALQQPLDSNIVHRPERVGPLVGLQPGETLEVEHLAALLQHPEGCLKGVPKGAKVAPLINGVADPSFQMSAQQIADLVFEGSSIHSISLGALIEKDPIVETLSQTAIVVLAAGGSQRFGGPKMLVNWRGKPLVRHVVEICLESKIGPIHIVLGDECEKVKSKIADLPVNILENRNWHTGQSSSVRMGVEAIREQCDAVVFVLGDMPLVEPQTIRGLVQMHRKSLAPIIAPHAGGRFGNPVLFDRVTFPDLVALEGDRGGRALFKTFPPEPYAASETVLFDVDVPEDLKRS